MKKKPWGLLVAAVSAVGVVAAGLVGVAAPAQAVSEFKEGYEIVGLFDLPYITQNDCYLGRPNFEYCYYENDNRENTKTWDQAAFEENFSHKNFGDGTGGSNLVSFKDGKVATFL